jgi:hypothetical protein
MRKAGVIFWRVIAGFLTLSGIGFLIYLATITATPSICNPSADNIVQNLILGFFAGMATMFATIWLSHFGIAFWRGFQIVAIDIFRLPVFRSPGISKQPLGSVTRVLLYKRAITLSDTRWYASSPFLGLLLAGVLALPFVPVRESSWQGTAQFYSTLTCIILLYGFTLPIAAIIQSKNDPHSKHKLFQILFAPEKAYAEFKYGLASIPLHGLSASEITDERLKTLSEDFGPPHVGLYIRSLYAERRGELELSDSLLAQAYALVKEHPEFALFKARTCYEYAITRALRAGDKEEFDLAVALGNSILPIEPGPSKLHAVEAYVWGSKEEAVLEAVKVIESERTHPELQAYWSETRDWFERHFSGFEYSNE